MLELSTECDDCLHIDAFLDSHGHEGEFELFLEELNGLDPDVSACSTAQAPSTGASPLLGSSTAIPRQPEALEDFGCGQVSNIVHQTRASSPVAVAEATTLADLPTRAEARTAKLRAKNRRAQKAYRERRKVWSSVFATWYVWVQSSSCLLYTSPSPRDATLSRMPSSA